MRQPRLVTDRVAVDQLFVVPVAAVMLVVTEDVAAVGPERRRDCSRIKLWGLELNIYYSGWCPLWIFIAP